MAIAPLDSAAAQSRLSADIQQLPEVFGNRRITLQWVCDFSGNVGNRLADHYSHVGWKITSTACHYLRMEQVLRSGGAGDSLSKLPLDLGEIYRRQNELMGFTKIASSSKVPSIQMTSDGQ